MPPTSKPRTNQSPLQPGGCLASLGSAACGHQAEGFQPCCLGWSSPKGSPSTQASPDSVRGQTTSEAAQPQKTALLKTKRFGQTGFLDTEPFQAVFSCETLPGKQQHQCQVGVPSNAHTPTRTPPRRGGMRRTANGRPSAVGFGLAQTNAGTRP